MTRGQDESGAVAIVTAILLLALVLMAAFVVDLGLLRADKATSQYISDSAAAAGALELDGTDATFVAACEAAWEYVIRNLPDVPDTTPSPCAAWYGSATCSGGIVPPNSIDLGPVVIEMTMPVAVDDPLMGDQAAAPGFDGANPCSRIGVNVIRQRDHLLARAAGFESGQSASAAVALAPSDNNRDFANLIVLDRTRCEALTTTGQGRVIVENIDPYTFPDGTVGVLPGMIQVDSDGTHTGGNLGCGGRYAVDAGANGLICAGVSPAQAAAIFSGVTSDCDSLPDTIQTLADEATDAAPDDVLAGRIDPDPLTIEKPVTRSIVDHRVNCHGGSYPSYNAGSDPQYPVEEIDGCKYSSQIGPHIDQLIDAFVRPTASSPPPVGGPWEHYGVGGIGTCADLRSGTVLPPGNYYLNCPGPSGTDSLTISNGESLEIEGPSTVIINGDLSVSGTGEFRLNANNPSPDPIPSGVISDGLDSLLVMREGEMVASGSGALQFERAFTYLHTGAVKSSSDNITWNAPIDTSYSYDRIADEYTAEGCAVDADDVPSRACFQNLALWTNNFGEHSLGGSGGMTIGGVFFTPNAGRTGTTTQFDLNGGAPQDPRHAQFFAHRIRVTGSGLIRMAPDPNRIFPLPDPIGGLIR